MDTFSEIIESSTFDQLIKHTNEFLQIFDRVDTKLCSDKHIQICWIEAWKTQLDYNKIVGAVWLDLSKDFDCIPHDLLIAKLDADGFGKEALSLICSCLKSKK